MPDIERVLIAVDDDSAADVAVASGYACARTHGADVRVVVVAHPRLTDDRRRQIEALAAAEAGQRNADIRVTSGTPVREIVREALDWQASLIVQASHPPGRRRFTGADWQLMRKSPIPAWIVKSRSYPWKSVAAAVDVGAVEPHTEAFNQHIVALAASLAAGVGAPLSVLSAWQLPGEATLRGSPMLQVSQPQLEDALAQARGTVEQRQRDLAYRLADQGVLDGEHIEWHAIHGEPREVLPDVVASRGAELLVMGTVGRTGIQGLLIGNTAESVLERLHCSVVTLKPPSFVSPER